jgi:hypothetical protein
VQEIGQLHLEVLGLVHEVVQLIERLEEVGSPRSARWRVRVGLRTRARTRKAVSLWNSGEEPTARCGRCAALRSLESDRSWCKSARTGLRRGEISSMTAFGTRRPVRGHRLISTEVRCAALLSSKLVLFRATTTERERCSPGISHAIGAVVGRQGREDMSRHSRLRARRQVTR